MKQKLAIFDFNGTIFPRETMPFLLKQWNKHSYSKSKLFCVFVPLIPLYIKYKIGVNSNISKEEMEVKAVKGVSRIFIGMNKKEIENFFSRAVSSASSYFNKKILEEIYLSNKNNYHTVILSGAFRLFLLQVGNLLNIDTVIGSQLLFDNECYNSVQMDIISGSNKLEKMQSFFKEIEIDWENSKAYADSYHDLRLLKSVGNPVAVDPDIRLESIANQKKWNIINSD